MLYGFSPAKSIVCIARVLGYGIQYLSRSCGLLGKHHSFYLGYTYVQKQFLLPQDLVK